MVQKVRQTISFTLNDKSPVTLPANDGNKKVSLTFNTNADWSVEVDGPWRLVSRESGGAGDGEVQLTAAPNKGLAALTGSVTIKAKLDGNEHTETVPCSQPACGIELVDGQSF